jgi:hypothetical protein
VELFTFPCFFFVLVDDSVVVLWLAPSGSVCVLVAAEFVRVLLPSRVVLVVWLESDDDCAKPCATIKDDAMNEARMSFLTVFLLFGD